MKKKILTIAFLALFALPARAGTIGNFFGRAFENAKYALSCGNNDLYVPVRTWHNRLFYDQEHIDKYNEEPWGIGFGRSFWEGNEWHGVYAMAFKDSNFYLETIAGYAYLYNWDLDNSGDWKVGVGYTLSLTQREEYMYIPVPLPLPMASLTYQRLSLQAAYIPGVKNDGNVLFAWLKWTF